MAVEFGPMGLDVPVSEDGQRVVIGVPGLRVCDDQGFRQWSAHLHARQLSQEMFQGQVFVSKAVDRF